LLRLRDDLAYARWSEWSIELGVTPFSESWCDDQERRKTWDHETVVRVRGCIRGVAGFVEFPVWSAVESAMALVNDIGAGCWTAVRVWRDELNMDEDPTCLWLVPSTLLSALDSAGVLMRVSEPHPSSRKTTKASANGGAAYYSPDEKLDLPWLQDPAS
jgi:hypothetical protein